MNISRDVSTLVGLGPMDFDLRQVWACLGHLEILLLSGNIFLDRLVQLEFFLPILCIDYELRYLISACLLNPFIWIFILVLFHANVVWL